MSETSSELTLIDKPDIYDVIAAVGNSENKAALLCAMEPGKPYTQKGMHDLHLHMQGPEPVWRMAGAVAFGYGDTFSSVGLVAKLTFGSNARPAYEITERGRRLAVPLLGHLMELSLTEKPTLLAYAGPANTTAEVGRRPNQKRIELMQMIADNKGRPLRGSQIAEHLNLGIGHGIAISDSLNAGGLVGKTRTGRGKTTLDYTGTPELMTVQLRTDIGRRILFDVLDVMRCFYTENPERHMSNRDIADEILRRKVHQDTGQELISIISGITSQLARQRGILVKHNYIPGDRFARETVWADKQQLALIAKYLLIIKGIQRPNPEYLSEGLAKAQDIMANPQHVRQLLLKSKSDAKGVKSTPEARAEMRNAIVRILGDSSSPLTVRQVQDELLKSGNTSSRNRVSLYLKALLALGKTTLNESVVGNAYSLVAPGDSTTLES